ncbi:UPF0182 family protein [Petroclostridium sp. X23]|uniref:UPF0182 family membrane protein n=1 Tax=Petroclostridium sp. X23 TaxID=3045146 RepID=UPI0024AC921E|nr:UPF0182 family protein [Petroclostridium sp. X23]WHH59419.1 UPF0182 family protein [Petroclostridium sp. X23]
MIYDYYRQKNRKSYIGLLIIVLALISLIMIGALLFGIFTDYIQIKEIGEKYTSVFWTNFNVKIVAQVASFLLVFVIFLTSTMIIRANMLSKDQSLEILKKLSLIILLSFIISFIASTFIRETVYNRFLMFSNALAFNKTDPIFNQDIGYYIFQRPFLLSVVDSLLGIWLFQTVYTFFLYSVLYVVTGYRTIGEMIYEKGIITHNLINVVVFFIIKAVTYKFKSEDILYSTVGEVVGAGYTDVNVWLRYYKVAPFILIAIVIITIILLMRTKIKYALMTVALFPVIWIVAVAAAGVVQTLVVSPNEVAVEEPYIKHNIDFTRAAYNLENIIEKEFPVDNNLSAQDIANNNVTINNIRITDFPATLTVLNQLQGIRNYYRFVDTDISVYDINGAPTAVFLGARELYKENLDDAAKTYINKKFKFTHGFGTVMNPINRITEQGQPEFIIKNIPPKSFEGAPENTQPRIYYGELTNDYVIANAKGQKELDYLEGEVAEEFTYDGDSGIKLSFLNKLIFAIRYGDLRMLVSGYITPESKILLNRNILQRVQRVAPFLNFDDDPYIVIDAEGKLKWVVDIYTTSGYYPYSQLSGGINYVRNSAKAVVDAYQGSVEFYITDETDPLINVYKSIYPDLFNEDPLPEDIALHVRYPEQLFKIQSRIFRQYHMTNPVAFYNKADSWAISQEQYIDEIKEVDPYYNLMKLPGVEGGQEELVLMIPYTLVNKENMVSWLAVRSTKDNYGQMVLYKFPKGINVYGTMQIENRIENSPDISRELSLWDQGGSSVIRGNLLVIPVNNSLLYVEPIYITASNESSLPEVKRIVVAYGEKIVMEPTLDRALEVLFGEDGQGPPDTRPDTGDTGIDDNIKQVIERALNAFRDMKDYTQKNDWENFGRKLKQLDDIMDILQQRKNELQ